MLSIQFEDYMNSFIGAIILLVSVITIPEIRRKTKYVITFIVLIIGMVILGFRKINRDGLASEKMGKAIERIDKDSSTINSMKNSINNIDSTQKVFLEGLEQMGVKKDALNHPYIFNKKEFINNIGKVGTLNEY